MNTGIICAVIVFFGIAITAIVIISANKVLYALKKQNLVMEHLESNIDIFSEHVSHLMALDERIVDSQGKFNSEVLDTLSESNNMMGEINEEFHKIGNGMIMLTQQNAIMTEKLSEIENRYSDIYEQFKVIRDKINSTSDESLEASKNGILDTIKEQIGQLNTAFGFSESPKDK